MEEIADREFMTVAVTGGTGFVGSHLLKELRENEQFKIRVLVHNNCPADILGEYSVDIVSGDLFDPETLNDFPTEGCTVINLVYPHSGLGTEGVVAIDNLGTACVNAKIKRFIHCSTAVVAGRVCENVVDEDTECNPISSYEIEKLAMERLLIEKYSDSFEVIILRPTAIFGPGGKNLLRMAASITRGNRFINYIRSCFYNDRKMNFIFVKNVTAALRFLIDYDKHNLKNEIFIISEDEDELNEYRKIELSILRSLGKKDYPIPIVRVPLSILKGILRFSGRTNYNPLTVYSSQKIFKTGFHIVASFQDGLNAFIEWYNINKL